MTGKLTTRLITPGSFESMIEIIIRDKDGFTVVVASISPQNLAYALGGRLADLESLWVAKNA